MSALPELKHVATAEIKGVKHNASIIKLIDAALVASGQKVASNQWLRNDETAWCGSFIGGVFAEAGLGSKVPKDFYRAKAWESVGTKLAKPAYGCIVTFTRDGGGHVGIVVGKTANGNLKVLGGNQSDAVNIADFVVSRVTSYRWISTGTVPNAHRYDLPVLPAGRISSNES